LLKEIGNHWYRFSEGTVFTDQQVRNPWMVETKLKVKMIKMLKVISLYFKCCTKH